MYPKGNGSRILCRPPALTSSSTARSAEHQQHSTRREARQTRACNWYSLPSGAAAGPCLALPRISWKRTQKLERPHVFCTCSFPARDNWPWHYKRLLKASSRYHHPDINRAGGSSSHSPSPLFPCSFGSLYTFMILQFVQAIACLGTPQAWVACARCGP